jgi:hyperosmotically inducible protein
MTTTLRNIVLSSTFALVSVAVQAQPPNRGDPALPGDRDSSVGEAPAPPEGAASSLQETLDSELLALGVTSDVQDNVVTLRGSVRDDAAKAHAERIARQIEGVAIVRNYITVDPAAASPSTLPDQPPAQRTAMLLTEVRQTIAADSRVAAQNIEVFVYEGGVVMLTGRVSSDEQKEAAGQIAFSNPAVKEVRNWLEVEDD